MNSAPDNGILASVPGQYVAQGANSLPSAQGAQVDTMEAVVEVPSLGAVRIRYGVFRYRKGRGPTNVVWVAKWAGRGEDGA